MSTPTGPAAGVHLPWARVPETVQAWAARLGAGPPRAVRDLSGGFSPGATAVLVWPEGSVFVKAVGNELNPESPDMHRREAVVSAALPPSPRFPRLLDTYDDGDWVALAFVAVDGRPPHHPWEAAELATVCAALAAMHGELTPSPAPGLEPLEIRAGRLFGGWASLAAEGAPAGLDPWARDHLRQLADLESGWPDACAGPTLVHGDVRGDNVLFTADGDVVFVDWPHAAVGNPGLRPRRLGAFGGPRRRARARGPARPLPGANGRSMTTPSRSCSPRSPASSSRTRSVRLPRATHPPPLPGGPGRGGAGVAAAPDRLVTTGRTEAPSRR